MEANELRIGNSIMFLNKNVIVERIENLDTRQKMYWIKPKGLISIKIIHFSGIPLTYERMMKLGFEKIEDLSKGQNNSFSYIDGNGFNISSDFIFETEFLNRKLIYVHELQNLYFLLTGLELTFNN